MSFSLEGCLHVAFRAVKEATKLDENDKNQGAYVQYLESMQYIIQCLLKDSGDLKQSSSVCRKKFVQIGLHCMDRVDKLSDNLAQQTAITPPSEPTNPQQNNQAPTVQPEPSRCPRPNVGSLSLPVGKEHSDDGSQSSAKPKRSLSVPTPPGGTTPVSHNAVGPQNAAALSGKLNPMEIALRQNQSLMEAYKSRISKNNRGTNYDSTLNLTIRRKMAENIALAKARQEALNKKIQERQARLKEITDRRFVGTIGMSADEQERRQLYTQILEYEHEKKWPLVWRRKLDRNPNDAVLIKEIIQKILQESDHPLTVLLRRYQFSIYNKLKPIVATYLTRVRKIDEEFQDYLNDQSSSNNSNETSLTKQETSDIAKPNSLNENDEDESDETTEDQGDIADDNSVNNEKDTEEGAMDNPEAFSSVLEESKKGIEGAIKESEKTMSRLSSVELVDEMDELFEEELSEIVRDDDDSTTTSNDEENQNSVENSQSANENESKSETVLKIEREACQRHLKDITKDVHIYLDKLIAMFVVAYQNLDSSVARDQCHVLVEEAFFNKVWPWLMILFRVVFEDEEEQLICSFKSHHNVLPKDVGVRDKWCLQEVEDYPYKSAIEELRLVTTMVCPLEKLECIVRVSRIICQCVEDYYTARAEKAPALGADDLLPILCYILLRCNFPQIVSECHAMEEFIHEGYLMGEEGYCLTSFLTALNYITSGMPES